VDTPFTPSELEWRMLAGACETVAEQERQNAGRCAGLSSRDFANSANEYERLAEACRRNVRSGG
jgi:hypothetical protein